MTRTGDPKRRATSLDEEHTPEAVSARLGRRPSVSYLRDFVYGAVDGAITTFAIVAGWPARTSTRPS